MVNHLLLSSFEPIFLHPFFEVYIDNDKSILNCCSKTVWPQNPIRPCLIGEMFFFCVNYNVIFVYTAFYGHQLTEMFSTKDALFVVT